MKTCLNTEHKLFLPQVTLCAVTSVNVDATLQALNRSLKNTHFDSCKLFTDKEILIHDQRIDIIKIEEIKSSKDYSKFVIYDLFKHISTTHCMIVQWDGHIIDSSRWRPEFLEYDYIGASWPQFDDGHDVGNGGFSLRTRRLMEACLLPKFDSGQVEDLAIGRVNRSFLEDRGMRFAPKNVADLFSTERAGDISVSFGYHGAFNMTKALSADDFWSIYCTLDDTSNIIHDTWTILRSVRIGFWPKKHILTMIVDYLLHKSKSLLPKYFS